MHDRVTRDGTDVIAGHEILQNCFSKRYILNTDLLLASHYLFKIVVRLARNVRLLTKWQLFLCTFDCVFEEHLDDKILNDQ